MLLENELGGEPEGSQRSRDLKSIRRELAELNADDLEPSDASGYPAPHGLKAHRLVTSWADTDPVKMAVLEVERIFLKRLP